jgi:hypothetical protein
VETSASTGDEWDCFAARCHASFRCSHRASRLWTLELGAATKLLRLDIILRTDGAKVKIGQCALGLNGRKRAFADSIQLLPDHHHHWKDAMRAILSAAGPGTYLYGSDWNLEASRAGDLENLARIRVTRVHPVDVVAIDFSDWADWASFYRDVSTNAKRNVKKAEKTYKDIEIATRHHLSIYRDVVPLQNDRFVMFARKQIPANRFNLIARSALRVFVMRDYAVSSRMLADGQVVARYLGFDFGQTSFYFEAASSHVETGASAYLLKAMIEDTFNRTQGRGIFIFGPDDHRQQGQQVWENLVRSRAQWNAKPHPTAIIEFEAGP